MATSQCLLFRLYCKNKIFELFRQGYGSRVAQSKITGARGSMMEDVMANMSKPSSSTCAGVIAGQGQTLTQVGLFYPLLPS